MMTQICKQLKKIVQTNDRILIVGRDKLVCNLFRSLIDVHNPTSALIILATANGRILSFLEHGKEDSSLTGTFIALSECTKCCPKLVKLPCCESYFLLTDKEEKDVLELQKILYNTLKNINEYEFSNEQLLNSLDVVQNAISIYDQDARILFANKRFCDDFHIDITDKPIGMKITDVTERFGLNFRSFDRTIERFKMLDVLKDGKEALDWEIRLEFDKDNIPSQLISNDIYPIKNDQGNVTGLVEITHSRQQDIRTASRISGGLTAGYHFDDIIGSSKQIQQRINIARKYAKSPYSILITGESGVGKELFAQSIHNYSPRSGGPFVAINCANFPENLIESELFGYVEGAFTGASRKGSIGKFELANSGTLFLDEIGELPYHFQSKLLRVLETMTVTRIGSNQEIPIDVRIVAATNRNLKQMIEDGFFREDLYFRLQVLNIDIPPLRQRKEDLLELTEALLVQCKAPGPTDPKKLSSESKKVLLAYDWPGNVRELRNVLSRASILSKSNEISAETLMRCIYPSLNDDECKQNSVFDKVCQPVEDIDLYDVFSSYLDHITDGATTKDDDRLASQINTMRTALQDTLIKKILVHTGGNKKRTAEIMGISRKTLYNLFEHTKNDV